MNHDEIVNEWCRRLESGTIPQAQSKLGYVDGSRCCLGVLCDIAAEQGIIPTPKEHGEYLLYCFEDEEQEHYLPSAVQRWAGLVSREGKFYTGDDEAQMRALADENDGGKTFADIARIIKSRPEGLFTE